MNKEERRNYFKKTLEETEVFIVTNKRMVREYHEIIYKTKECLMWL